MPLDADDLKQISELLATSLAEGMKPILLRLDGVEKVEQPDVAKLIADALKDHKPGAKEETGGLDDATKARLIALETQLEESKNATATAEKARGAEKMLSALRTQLLAADVPPARVRAAIALLHHDAGRISLAENGEAQMRFDRQSAGGAYTDSLGLSKGVSEWLETDEGKTFLPAKQVRGVDQTAHNRFGTTTPDGKINAKSIISQALAAAQRR